jgi:hypothetical protein
VLRRRNAAPKIVAAELKDHDLGAGGHAVDRRDSIPDVVSPNTPLLLTLACDPFRGKHPLQLGGISARQTDAVGPPCCWRRAQPLARTTYARPQPARQPMSVRKSRASSAYADEARIKGRIVA